jgi:uncharacterized SAM-binding protein YcdF (DUF218 family)
MISAASVSITKQWAELTHRISGWLTDPWLVSLCLLTILIFSYLLQTKRWQRYLRGGAVALLVLYWLVISPPGAALALQGLTRFLPPDPGETADAIVVLTRVEGIEGDRYLIAVQLWQQHRAPKIFATLPHNVNKVRSLLASQHVDPLPVLQGSLCALTTYDEAFSAAGILGPQGVKKIILISDPAHLLRASLTFQGFGFFVIPYASPFPPRLRSAEITASALREYFGLISYSLLGRFNAQPASHLGKPSDPVLKELADRHCQIKLSQ